MSKFASEVTIVHFEDTLELADEHTGVIEKIEDPDAAYLFMPELFQIQSCIHRFIWKMDLFL